MNDTAMKYAARRILFRQLPLQLAVVLAAGVMLFFTLSLTGCGDNGDDDNDTDVMDATDGMEDTQPDGTDVPDMDEDADATDTDDGDTQEDGETDVPPDEDMEVDTGGCDPACGDNQSCEEGMCVCNENFGDCNMDSADGCETSLLTIDNCGTCGNAPATCTAHGVDGSCMVNTPGMPGICPVTCLNDYFDVDGEESNGCETGLPFELTADLSADIPGSVLDSALDGDMLYVLVDDTNLKIVPIDLSGAMPAVGTLVDVGVPQSGKPEVTADAGIVATHGAGFNLYVYELTGGALQEVETETFSGIAAIAEVASPVVTNATAEFVVAGSGGTRWYGTFPMGMEPASLPGSACSVPSANGTILCLLGEDANPSDGARVEAAVLNGNPFAIVAGSSTVELGLAPSPFLDPRLVNGDNISVAWGDAVTVSDVLYASEGNDIGGYEYTFNMGGNPSSRSRSVVGTTEQATNSLAVLDEGRLLIGASDGLTVMMLSDGTKANTALVPSVATMDLENGSLAVIDDAKQLTLFGTDLGAL